MELGLTERLQTLQVCFDAGQISAEEYPELRRRLLDSFVQVGGQHAVYSDSIASVDKPRYRRQRSFTSFDEGEPLLASPMMHVPAADHQSAHLRVSQRDADNHVADPDFWCKMVRGTFGKVRHLDMATVNDLCDITAEHVESIFTTMDVDDDGLINSQELVEGLAARGFDIGHEDAITLLLHVRKQQGQVVETDTQEEPKITVAEFDMVQKRLRLAELFTPTEGLFQFTTGDCHSEPILHCVDYSASSFDEQVPIQDVREFFFTPTRQLNIRSSRNNSASTPVRWIHYNAADCLDRLTLMRLAVKYHLHPLAMSAIMDLDSRTPTKVDPFADNYFISLDVLVLADDVPANDPTARVRMQQNHVSLFLAGHGRTLLTIHQRASEADSWLCLLRGTVEQPQPASSSSSSKLWGLDIWRSHLAC